MLRSAKKDEKWGPHKTSMFRLHSQLLKLARPRDPNPIFLHDGVIPFPEAENAFEVRPYKMMIASIACEERCESSLRRSIRSYPHGLPE